MKNLRAYISENRRWLAVIVFIALVMTATMLLNRIPSYEIGYGMLLCGFVTAAAISIGYGRHRESFRQLEQMQKTFADAPDDMKIPEYMYERQYQACIQTIAKEKNQLQKEMENRQQDLSGYYSMWVHQIKTPIAALKLLLDEEMNACLDDEEISESDERIINVQRKQYEVFRIEQYVDMALQYTRLGAHTNDFVFERVEIDEAVKPSIHKYAKQFIHRQLRLNYEPRKITAVTDRKWLGFVIDQLLSNAVKYTKQGGITIEVFQADDQGRQQQEHRHEMPLDAKECVHIVIEDTGIGISAADLPRVCEMGYTGYNGHEDQYSTGIGLYLCSAILEKLGHRFVLTSEQGRGTRAEIII